MLLLLSHIKRKGFEIFYMNLDICDIRLVERCHIMWFQRFLHLISVILIHLSEGKWG